MIVDTYAIIANATHEQDSDRLLMALVSAEVSRVSAGTLLETYIVMGSRLTPHAMTLFHEFLERVGLVVEPVTGSHAEIARDAYHRYGRGSGHGARLNFGDCLAYALAKERNEPLLYVGNDFSQTDLKPAI